jgi:hypothetical protein
MKDRAVVAEGEPMPGGDASERGRQIIQMGRFGTGQKVLEPAA